MKEDKLELEWEPLFALSVKKKKEPRMKQKTWGPFSLKYIPWSKQTIFEKFSCAVVVIGLLSIPILILLVGA